MTQKILILANDTNYTYNLRDVLIARLVEANYSVTVASECLDYQKELRQLGARLISLRINRHSKNPFSDFLLLASLLQVLKNEKSDIVLTYNIKPNVYGGIASRLAGIPYIANITGLGTVIENGGIMQKVSLALYRIGLSGADCVMFQNEANRQAFQANGILRSGTRTCLLPGSGVNLEKFREEDYPAPDTSIVFSTVGRIMKDKGINELIQAIRIVKPQFPQVVFRLIGPFDEDCKSDVLQADEEGLLEYLGPQKDVRGYLKDSWAVIHASYHEGMSNVLLESAATGRPILASDIPGCRETFDPEISGYGFPAGDAEALAAAIIRFIALPYEEKRRMGQAGRRKMEKEYDRNIVAEEYLKIIKTVNA